MFTIFPDRWAIMTGVVPRVHRKVAVRLTASVATHSSSVISQTGASTGPLIRRPC